MWMKAAAVVLARILWLALSLISAAGAQSINIRLTTPSTAGVTVTPGSQASVELRFTNLGPADSLGVYAVSTYYPNSLFFVGLIGPSPPCSIHYDSLSGPFGETFFAAIVEAGPLAAGSTVSCTIAFSSDLRASRIFQFAFGAEGGSPGVTESDRSDNAIFFPLILGPVRGVPALGLSGLMLLIFGLCVIARRHFRWS